MGGLVRCDGCGALRWSPLRPAAGGEPATCEICGEPLKPERRRPGRKFRGAVARERRDVARKRRDVTLPVSRPVEPAG